VAKKPDNVNVNVNVKRIGRKRRAAGWTLLTLGVIVAGVWAASGWLRVEVDRRTFHVVVDSGLLTIQSGPPAGRERPFLSPSQLSEWSWRIRDLINEQRPEVRLALWPIPLLLWTPAALLLRSGTLAQRRANTNACAKCGYSLAGLADGAPCPECGRAETKPATTV